MSGVFSELGQWCVNHLTAFLFVRAVLTECLAKLEHDNTVPEDGFRVEVRAKDVALDDRMLYGFVIL